MGSPLVTVAIVPRERFSFAKTSLDNILATTTGDYELLYVDGNSPPDVRDYIARQAEAHAFRVLRREAYLSPNQARNLAAAHVRTRYVVFIDNDVLVSPGWLEALVDCAEKTGAWVVGPIYCERLPVATWIHMAGGDARFTIRDGRRVLHEDHRHFGRPLAEVRPQLRREPTEQIEFHCALVRRDVFDRLGPLDEQLWSAAEHTDLCLAVREAGGEVYVEPDSVITYVPPPPFTKADRDYYMLRWSHAWNAATLERFRAKWKLADDDPALAFLASWLDKHRRIAWHRVNRAARWLGATPARWLANNLINPLEKAINCRRYPHVLSYRADGASTLAARRARAVYAQTNLQLYNQLIAAGRADDELRLVRDAYELALPLFAGHFRGTGKPFLAHLIGVASVLAAHDRPIETVAAGLLHSVYDFGEFGDGTRGISPRKRRQVRLAVGEPVERLIAKYAAMPWGLPALADLEPRANLLAADEITALEIKVADVLDDHFDRGLEYAPSKKLVNGKATNDQWIEALARAIKAAGRPAMAAELESIATIGGPIPGCLVHARAESFVVAPLSHRERIMSLVARKFSRRRHGGRLVA
jgi:GT2 family glycosyltransferase